jgi:hypothetical protein
MTEALRPDQRSVLACVLDEIVPPSADGRMPGAGALGLADAVERFVANAGALSGLANGLDALAAQGFPTLPREQRAAALAAFAARETGFVPGLIFPTYTSYYQHPRVYHALGLDPRPPHPQGYTLEAGDFAKLEAVRARGPIWRRA